MPLKLGLKEIKRNMLMYSFVVMLLIVIFVISTFAVAVTRQSIQKYVAVKKVMDRENSVCYCTTMLMDSDTGVLIENKEQLRNVLGMQMHIAGQYAIVGAVADDEEANVWSYDQEIIEAYRPNLVKGRWFREDDVQQKDILYGVAIEGGAWTVGDIVQLEGWEENTAIDVKIIGLIKDSSDVVGLDEYKERTYDYTDCFYTYNLEGEGKPLLLLANDQLDGVLQAENGKGSIMQRQQQGLIFIALQNAQEQEALNIFMYSSDGMTLCMESAKEIQAGSEKIIQEILSRTLPVVVCSFILVLLVTISIGTVSVKQQLHNYAIYNLCGLSWGRCTMISFAGSLICSVFAFGISHIGMLAAKFSGALSEAAFEISLFSVGTCLIVQMVYIGISLIIPMCVVKGKSVKSILIANQE
ncbi:MAG: hypothetical protein NC124_07285 [Clostridium sp.]|nr:hypothetical protein [Clostridium sp.]